MAGHEERTLDAPEPEAIDFDAAIGQEDEEMPDVDEPCLASHSCASLPRDPEDISELLEHKQNRSHKMSKFELAIAILVENEGFSRSDYETLREALCTSRCNHGEPIDEFSRMPMDMSTVRSRLRSRLPLLDMRKAPIPLKVEKLPTATVQDKRDKGKGRATDSNHVMSDLHFFDPASVFVKVMSSDLRKQMHLGPAHFVDEPTELFHAHAWASSVRTSSGVYPHFPDTPDGKKGSVIFPSDFIYYCCQNDQCRCHTEGNNYDNLHIGRVYGFGYDHGSSPCADRDQLVLQIQEAFFPDSPHTPINLLEKIPAWNWEECVLASDVTYIPESNAIGSIKVNVDRVSGETHDDPQP